MYFPDLHPRQNTVTHSFLSAVHKASEEAFQLTSEASVYYMS